MFFQQLSICNPKIQFFTNKITYFQNHKLISIKSIDFLRLTLEIQSKVLIYYYSCILHCYFKNYYINYYLDNIRIQSIKIFPHY